MYRLLFISFLVWISVICNAQDTINSKSIIFNYSQSYIGKDLRIGIKKIFRKQSQLSIGVKFYMNDVYDRKGFSEKRYKALFPEHRGGIFINYGKIFYTTPYYNLAWEIKNQFSYLKTDFYWNIREYQRDAIIMESLMGIVWKIKISDKLAITESLAAGISATRAFKRFEPFGHNIMYQAILFKLNYQLSAGIEYKF